MITDLLPSLDSGCKGKKSLKTSFCKKKNTPGVKNKALIYLMRLEPKLPIISAKLSRVFSKKVLTSCTDLLMTKPKARSGQVRKFNFFDWLGCE